jgi:hypothetical protein
VTFKASKKRSREAGFDEASRPFQQHLIRACFDEALRPCQQHRQALVYQRSLRLPKGPGAATKRCDTVEPLSWSPTPSMSQLSSATQVFLQSPLTSTGVIIILCGVVTCSAQYGSIAGEGERESWLSLLTERARESERERERQREREKERFH